MRENSHIPKGRKKQGVLQELHVYLDDKSLEDKERDQELDHEGPGETYEEIGLYLEGNRND